MLYIWEARDNSCYKSISRLIVPTCPIARPPPDSSTMTDPSLAALLEVVLRAALVVYIHMQSVVKAAHTSIL